MINLACNLLSSKVDQFKLTSFCVTLECEKLNLAARCCNWTISNLYMSQYVGTYVYYGALTVDV